MLGLPRSPGGGGCGGCTSPCCCARAAEAPNPAQRKARMSQVVCCRDVTRLPRWIGCSCVGVWEYGGMGGFCPTLSPSLAYFPSGPLSVVTSSECPMLNIQCRMSNVLSDPSTFEIGPSIFVIQNPPRFSSLRGSASQCYGTAALPQKWPDDGRAVERCVTRQSPVTSA